MIDLRTVVISIYWEGLSVTLNRKIPPGYISDACFMWHLSYRHLSTEWAYENIDQLRNTMCQLQSSFEGHCLLLLIVVFWNHAVEKHIGQYHMAETNTRWEEVGLFTKVTILKSHIADITVVTAKSHMWIFPLRVGATLWEVQNKHFEKGKMSLI